MNEMINQFQQFMKMMQGRNPNEMLNTMINSGQVNQQQLNYAQQKAREVEAQFGNMKGMFGFK